MRLDFRLLKESQEEGVVERRRGASTQRASWWAYWAWKISLNTFRIIILLTCKLIRSCIVHRPPFASVVPSHPLPDDDISIFSSQMVGLLTTSRSVLAAFFSRYFIRASWYKAIFTKILLLFALQFMGSAWCHLLFTIHEANRPYMWNNWANCPQMISVTEQTVRRWLASQSKLSADD